ncbi:hypothetical protein [Clostridium transplantifaecale]|uniref:hypothetical protein n=1 Tax=Clostridium transplantifaecale TaxID=2479838 RepID=UPI000F6309D9|nr:hypothetical protein [Clostridium transplantifaecale]
MEKAVQTDCSNNEEKMSRTAAGGKRKEGGSESLMGTMPLSEFPGYREIWELDFEKDSKEGYKK